MLGGFTEPYYGAKIHYFNKNYSNIGIGIEHTHFKTFLINRNQKIKIKGKINGEDINKTDSINNYFKTLLINS